MVLPIVIIGIALAGIFVIAILILVVFFFLHPWALVAVIVVPAVAYILPKVYKKQGRRRRR